jgi:hypothetical protein
LPLQTVHHPAVADHNPILGTTWSSIGAVLIVVGAILVLFDAATGQTWGGDRLFARLRLYSALALGGSLLILSGSIVLVIVAGTSLLAVGIVVAIGAILVYGLMTYNLWAAMNERAKVDAGVEPHASVWWCLRNPRHRVMP